MILFTLRRTGGTQMKYGIAIMTALAVALVRQDIYNTTNAIGGDAPDPMPIRGDDL